MITRRVHRQPHAGHGPYAGRRRRRSATPFRGLRRSSAVERAAGSGGVRLVGTAGVDDRRCDGSTREGSDERTGIEQRSPRRRFLQVSAVAGAAVALGGVAAACNTAGEQEDGHVQLDDLERPLLPHQLDEIEKATRASAEHHGARPTTPRASPSSRRSTGQLDMISGDALWVPKYFEDGLIEAVRHQRASRSPSSSTRSPASSRSGPSRRATWAIPSAGRRSRSTTTRSTSSRRPTRGRCCSTRSTRAGSSSRTSPSRDRRLHGQAGRRRRTRTT